MADGSAGGEIVVGKIVVDAAAVPTAAADVKTDAAINDDCATGADVGADGVGGRVTDGVAAEEHATSNEPTTRLSGAPSNAPADRRPTIEPRY